MQVTVFHNVTKDAFGYSVGFAGYQPGHTVVKVAVLDLEVDDVQDAMHHAYHLLNVGDDPTFGPPDPQALTYRWARNRSLSVGDLLVFDGVAYAVAGCGFEQVSLDPAQVSQQAAPGSTPLGGRPYERVSA